MAADDEPPTNAELAQLMLAMAEVRRDAAPARDLWRCPWCGSPTSGPNRVCRAHAQLERVYQQARWGNGG
jgi:hypothetical protein